MNWAGNPDTALYAVTVPYIWRTLPFAIILVHAALQGIPRELYEQAAIDGANAWHRFRKITWPMLQQIIAIILILRTAFAFAVFEEILAITQGGPGDATWVAAWYSYKITFAPPNNFGMGSASAFILHPDDRSDRAGLPAPDLSTGDALMFKTTPTVKLLLHVANLMVIFFILLPVVAVFIGSIQSEKALQADTRRVLPLEFTLDNFTVILTKGEQKGRIFEQATYLPDNIKNFYAAFANSPIVAISVTVLTLLFGSLSAYTLARLRYRWTLFLLQANIVARFVPVIVLMIPLYVVMRSVGQLNSLSGVIIAETGFLLPYAILILAPYFDTIPAELEEAARIDGCTRFSAFVRIVLPLATPALAACGVIMFIISWHELLIPLILNARPELHDPAGGDREPGRRRPCLLQPDDGDLPAGAGADRGAGRAAAEVHRRGPVGRRREGLTAVIPSVARDLSCGRKGPSLRSG